MYWFDLNFEVIFKIKSKSDFYIMVIIWFFSFFLGGGGGLRISREIQGTSEESKI